MKVSKIVRNIFLMLVGLCVLFLLFFPLWLPTARTYWTAQEPLIGKTGITEKRRKMRCWWYEEATKTLKDDAKGFLPGNTRFTAIGENGESVLIKKESFMRYRLERACLVPRLRFARMVNNYQKAIEEEPDKKREEAEAQKLRGEQAAEQIAQRQRKQERADRLRAEAQRLIQ